MHFHLKSKALINSALGAGAVLSLVEAELPDAGASAAAPLVISQMRLTGATNGVSLTVNGPTNAATYNVFSAQSLPHAGQPDLFSLRQANSLASPSGTTTLPTLARTPGANAEFFHVGISSYTELRPHSQRMRFFPASLPVYNFETGGKPIYITAIP